MTNDDKNDYKYDDNDDDTLAPALPPLRPGGRSLAVARRCFLPGVAGGRAGPGSPSFHSGRWLVVHGHKVFAGIIQYALSHLIYHCGGNPFLLPLVALNVVRVSFYLLKSFCFN